MSDTSRLTLPLLAAAQAQKHVTLNEALVRLDAAIGASAISASLSSPPVGAVDGDAYVVGDGASGAWIGREYDLAFWTNGGWSFLSPTPGATVWVEDQGARLTWIGDRWVADLAGGHFVGAYSQIRVIGADVALSGAVVTTSLIIPDRAVVFGVTARVTDDIVGSGVTGWRIGVSGSSDRYGSGIGLVKDSTANGVTGAPVAYYADTPVELEAEGGAFASGGVRLALHYLILTPPDAV